MVEAPEVGGAYWIITGLWEVLTPVPVTLIAEAEGVFTGRWQITEEYTEDYEGLEPHAIYATKAAAWEVINKRSVER